MGNNAHERSDSADSNPEDKAIMFFSLVTEGDLLTRRGDYTLAIKKYTEALEIKPDSISTLICRARCHTLQGDVSNAIADAEKVLVLQPDSPKAILCKADALFEGGNFEMAMVWYHRGERLRGDIQEFTTGIARCHKVIEMAVETVDVNRIRLQRAKDKMRERSSMDELAIRLSTNVLFDHSAVATRQPKPQTFPAKSSDGKNTQLTKSIKGKKATTVYGQLTKDSPVRRSSTIEHNLLEEIYEDYTFIKELKTDLSLMNVCDGQVGDLVNDAVKYLDSRIDFWQARNPKGAKTSTLYVSRILVD